MEKRNFRLRVSFAKGGRLSYLSHLEVTHALERMIRRSGLPYALSEGFSPHMKISFGSALGVGIGSTCEIFDITLTDYIAPKKALSLLQENASDDLMPYDAAYVDKQASAASVAFPYSAYIGDFSEELPDFVIPEEITVVKKKKQKTLNVADYLIEDPIIDGNRLIFQLKSSNSGSLRPDVFLKSCNLPDLKTLTRIRQAESPVDLDGLLNPETSLDL